MGLTALVDKQTPPPPEPPDAAERRRASLRVDLLALAGFGTLLAAVKAGRTADIDLAITLRVQRRTSPAFDALMRAVAWPGFPPQRLFSDSESR